MSYRIVTEKHWTILGWKERRRIEGEPTFEALKAWREGEDIGAPSVDWLKAALDDTLRRVPS